MNFKKKILTRVIAILIALAWINIIPAQSEPAGMDYPTVGKPCPNVLLTNIKYYSRTQARLNEFKGKWLVLDFWNKSCGACIMSFPKTNSLQNEFNGKVQVILVGIQDKEGQIEAMYAKFRKKENLIMPCAFDSSLAIKWDIYTAPYIVVIDPDGIVRTITYSFNSADMKDFLEGNPTRLPKAYRVHEEEVIEIPYDKKKPFLIKGNGGEDTAFIFRSLFSVFDAYKQPFSLPYKVTDDSSEGRFQVLGAPLYMLYNYAFYGAANPEKGYRKLPVLEVRDSSMFKYSEKYNKNMFCYSLMLPLSMANCTRIQAMMQKDLENYFGYAVSIEERRFPCWKLLATEDARQHLKTRGGQRSVQSKIPKIDLSFQNFLFKDFLKAISSYSGIDIMDETGISGNVDIHMECIMTDINELKKAFQMNGLELMPAERPMKVLVIRDMP